MPSALVWQIMLLIWWTAGMVWLAFRADGRQLAEIRPASARYAAVVLTFPAFWAFWLLVRGFEFGRFLAHDLRRSWRIFADAIQGIKAPEGEDAQ